MATSKGTKKPATKKATTKTPSKSAPTGTPGSAVVRTMCVDEERAADLVEKFGFWVGSKNGEGKIVVCADEKANAKYEATL